MTKAELLAYIAENIKTNQNREITEPLIRYIFDNIIETFNNYPELDETGKIKSENLPSYVDDVIEVTDYSSLPTTGESGKIYVTIDNGKTYRWSGSSYIEISPTEIKSAEDVPTDTTNFGGALSSADDNVQKALDTLDNAIISGTYMPTLASGATNTNVSDYTLYTHNYIRIGNIVFVSGYIGITPTLANTTTIFFLSIPIASNIEVAEDLTGGGGAFSNYSSVGIYGAGTYNCARIVLKPTISGSNISIGYSFSYNVK